MTKGDVPRLRRFLGIMMRSNFSDMPGKDMVQLVDDMKWIAAYADKLDAKPEGIKVLSTSPIVDSKIKGKKKK